MPNTNPTPETTNPQPDAPETPNTTDSADTPQPTGKTFTEAEVNAMIAARLAKLEKSLKKQHDEDSAKAAERAKLDESERLKAELEDARKRASEIEERAVNAERRAALTGKVADPIAALKLLDADKHLTEEGDVNPDALLADYPFLKPTPRSVGAAGGPPVPPDEPTDLQARIRKAETDGDWMTAMNLKNELAKQLRAR